MKKLKPFLIFFIILLITALVAGLAFYIYAKTQPLELGSGEDPVSPGSSFFLDDEDLHLYVSRGDISYTVTTAYDFALLVDGEEVLIPAGTDLTEHLKVFFEDGVITVPYLPFSSVFSQMYPESIVHPGTAADVLTEDLFVLTVDAPMVDPVTVTFMLSEPVTSGVKLDLNEVIF